MAGVTVIKGVEVTGAKSEPTDGNLKRVAAYCRVSTDEAEQLVSYSSQIKYYTDLINSRSDWQMAGIYADESITGTLAYKRDQFLRLIADCKAGKIDMVITKSISRFARNVVDVLKYVRILKKHDVSVYFEEEKIDTLTMDGEMVLSVLGAVCQQEAANVSANVSKGLKMKMIRGELVGNAACLGYDYDVETKQLVVNEEEATIVRYIFRRYLDGAGARKICLELIDLGAKTKSNNLKWSAPAVMGILKNEKYVGDVVQGKTYVVNPITKQRATNHGEKDMYKITDDHPGIISREDFDKAQEICRARKKFKSKPSTPGLISPSGRRYAFSHMLICGFCGGILVRRHVNIGTKWEKIIWACSDKVYRGSDKCPLSKGVRDSALKDAFITSFNKIKGKPPQEVINSFIEIAREVLTKNDYSAICDDMKKKLAEVNTKLDQILDMKIDGLIDSDMYKRKFEKLQAEKKQYTETLEENETHLDYDVEKRLEGFRKIIESNPDMEKFNREIFDTMIDKVIIGNADENGVHPYNVKFIYSNGFEDCVDTTDMHGVVPGGQVKTRAKSKDTDETPFDGTQDVFDRQKGLLKNLLNQGVLNQVSYNESMAKISQAVEKARSITSSIGG